MIEAEKEREDRETFKSKAGERERDGGKES